MYRPWWFPEFTPKEQRIFDAVLNIATETFEQHSYQHIWTPAVEPVEILKKGWDIIDKQVFGLFWLAQWVEDVKDYALHFDLTVPLARYVLDHRNDLTFPFSRYQMQPVWRWERTKRWRFKEFWQMDIDTIWPSDMNVGVWYDIQSVYVMDMVMQKVLQHFHVAMNTIAKVSHLLVTKNYLVSLWLNEEQMNVALKVLDNYFKRSHEEAIAELSETIPADTVAQIEHIIKTKDYTKLATVEWYEQLAEIITKLSLLGVKAEYDICIVRWHNYYNGMVVEWFDTEEVAYGSLAAGGRYNNLTDFIDAKQSFSWVGTSLWRFAYSLVEKVKETNTSESYLFINFSETIDEITSLYRQFIAAGKRCELYPTAAKLGKQFEYADRVGADYSIVYGPWEKEKWRFIIKNMKTGESAEWVKARSYGVIPVYEEAGVKKILLVQIKAGWGRGFPKWHNENNETPLEAAIRELQEEVGIVDVKIPHDVWYTENYFIVGDSHYHAPVIKSASYTIGYVVNRDFTIQESELLNAQWFTIAEAKRLPLHKETRWVIDEIASHI